MALTSQRHRKTFTYDKYGWDVDEDNNLIENEKEQYWIEYIKVRYHEDDISISTNYQENSTPVGLKNPHKQGEEFSIVCTLSNPTLCATGLVPFAYIDEQNAISFMISESK